MSFEAKGRPFLVASPRGGLGNQLFNLAAALSVATSHGWDVKVDVRQTAHVNLSGSHPIEELLPSRYASSAISVLRSSVPSLIGKRSLRRGVVSRIPLIAPILKAHSSRGLGYDASLLGVREGTRVYGYYQTYRYLEQLDRNEFRRSLQLRRPTAQFDQLKRQTTVDVPIVVHVRRGDYASNGTFGLLGHAYYSDAISMLRDKVGERPVWVFSDEPLEASAMIPKADRFIGPELGAAETLTLMSQGSGLISANSSLSWWAGCLSDDTCQIVAPDPWFAGIELDTDALLPPHWTRLAPSFITHVS